ncbi:D-cysteine desulfhydrase family protein [Paraburkholderia caribensis]|uniref:D-cysteine desulfhydrase family protein n=1 Tax=Paraburkholderia caribensis TaxID=75105 RepID=UPI001CACA3EF|nr:D-cysteine desulfhydrase family protein [Paraburkholderia caribensis]CAG9261647.1 L-cysteate sulfo-lyase [Paraburkholderia caribensis]
MKQSKLDLSRFPRATLRDGPSPIQHLPRLSRALNGPEIYVKRDDLDGLGGGGNKLRKLEFLLGEALAAGADTIITVGGRQSNHARLTAAAAARTGLRCELVLSRLVPIEDEDYVNNGNVLLDVLFGAVIHDISGDVSALDFAEERAVQLRSQGRRVYVCPLGGSSPVGCLGYVSCAAEIDIQAAAQGISFDRIVVANGSGGMQAGLVSGFIAMGKDPDAIVGYTVLAPLQKALETTFEKTKKTLELLDSGSSASAHAVILRGEQLGTGYGVPTDAMREALSLAATLEGLLLDPVYGAKAFAGFIDEVRTGAVKSGDNALFVMSGGTPSLFAYRRALQQTIAS